jgi:hypothetical protein
MMRRLSAYKEREDAARHACLLDAVGAGEKG